MSAATPAAGAGIGFTVKSGWACAVLVVGSLKAPRVADSRRVELSDPDEPESVQPYHAGFGTARGAGAELSRLLATVKRFGGHSVTTLIRQHRASGHAVTAAGLVVGSTIDPARIANDHIRIHALEGQLFRGVVHDAATKNGLSCSIWRDRDLFGVAAETLKQPEAALRAALTSLGRDVDGPWRAEQKSAALAGWLVLAARVTPTSAGRRQAGARQ